MHHVASRNAVKGSELYCWGLGVAATFEIKGSQHYKG